MGVGVARDGDRDERTDALRAAVGATAAGATVVEALGAAAAAVGPGWPCVRGAGPLARASWQIAGEAYGLSPELTAAPPGAPGVVAVVAAGQLGPLQDGRAQRLRGAFDTPAALAREVVEAARSAALGPVATALDPACGAGALLVALGEAGLPATGADVDPLVVIVAAAAAPLATVSVADLLDGGSAADLVVGNPPFVSSERQDEATRARLRARTPWLRGRFDLAVPCADALVGRAREGGGVGLILPTAVLVEAYGAALRRRWLSSHTLTALGERVRFHGVRVGVSIVGLRAGTGPAPVGPWGLDPAAIAALPLAPLDPAVRPGDLAIVAQVRAASRDLGSFSRIDTGVVAHGADGGKERLLHDAPGPRRVPFADARDLILGRVRWLDWDPSRMHRPKDPGLFEPAKLIVQRVRGSAATRVVVDRSGLWVGHTCTCVVPRGGPPLERLAALVAAPEIAGLLRVERGRGLDLYPHAVAAVPVPRAWWEDPHLPLGEAWGLSSDALARLAALGDGPGGGAGVTSRRGVEGACCSR